MTTPTAAQDVVAVLKADLTQVFVNARAIKVSIGRASKLMEHPLETGATIVDHRVILQNTAELSMILSTADYRAVYQQVRDLFISGELLTVQTRVDSFRSMVIEKMPHEESGDIFDGVALALSLKEAQFVVPQFAPLRVRRPKDSNTVKRGQLQPTETAPARKQSVLGSWFK